MRPAPRATSTSPSSWTTPGEIDRALSGRLQNWASFRNVLVHEYLTIDHAIAYRAIRDELGSLDALRRWALGKLDADRS